MTQEKRKPRGRKDAASAHPDLRVRGRELLAADSETTDPNMQPIIISLSIVVPASLFIIEIAVLDFYRKIVLSAGQQAAVLAQIKAAQKQIVDGLIALVVISGTRTAGV